MEDMKKQNSHQCPSNSFLTHRGPAVQRSRHTQMGIQECQEVSGDESYCSLHWNFKLIGKFSSSVTLKLFPSVNLVNALLEKCCVACL